MSSQSVRQIDWLDYQVKFVKVDKLELVKVHRILVYQWRLHSTLFTMVFRFFLFNCAATPEGLGGWVQLLIKNLIPYKPKRQLALERSCQYPKIVVCTIADRCNSQLSKDPVCRTMHLFNSNQFKGMQIEVINLKVSFFIDQQ